VNALVPTLLGAVVAPALLGCGVVRALGLSPRDGRRAFVAWAYLVGHFALAWVTFAWAAAGRALPGWLLPVAAASIGTMLWWLTDRHDARRAVTSPRAVIPPRVPGDRWVAGAVLALSVAVLERGSLRNLHAVLDGDSANIWSAKARLLMAPGAWQPLFGTNYVQHADYPLFNPLVQVLAFGSSGESLWWEHRLPMQLFAVALLLLLSTAVERRLPRWLAIAVLATMATSVFLTMAPTLCADVLLALGLLGTVDAWSRWRATGRAAWWRLGCIGMAAMLATKAEGAMLTLSIVLAGAVALLVSRATHVAPEAPERRARLTLRQLAWLLVPVVTLAAGQWFNATYGLANDLASTGADGRGLFGRIVFWFPDRILPVLGYYADLAVAGGATRWLFGAALLAPLAAGMRARCFDAAWPWLTVVVALCGYVLVFVGTTANSGGPDGPSLGLVWHLGTAADRTVLHLLPTAALAFAAMLGPREVRHGAAVSGT